MRLLLCALLTLAVAAQVPDVDDQLKDDPALNVAPPAPDDEKWHYQSFKTQPDFHPPVFDYEKYGETAPGYFFMSMHGARAKDQAVFIISETGDLIWQRPESGLSDHLQLTELNEEKVLVFFSGVNVPDSKHVYGEVHVTDTSFTEKHLITLDFPRTIDLQMQLTSLIDPHEAHLTNYGTMMVIGMNATAKDLSPAGGPVNGWLFEGVVYEIDVTTNQVIWEWQPADHIPMASSFHSMPGILNHGTSPDDAWDWIHLNSIQEFGDGFIIDGRHTCSVYYVNKTTGDVIWTLTGFGDGGDFRRMDGDAVFCWQHTANIIPVSDKEVHITVHANNNYLDSTKQISYGLRVRVDLENMTYSTIHKYYDSSLPAYSWAEGSYETLANDNVLVNHGKTPVVYEYSPEGEILYKAFFGYQSKSASYRIYRHEFVGRPATIPDVAACLAYDGNLEVYMSWNGATEYTSWNVYCDDSKYPEINIPRMGFETNVTIGCPLSVQVEAVEPDGNKTKSSSLPLTHIRECSPFENDLEQIVLPHRSHEQAL